MGAFVFAAQMINFRGPGDERAFSGGGAARLYAGARGGGRGADGI